jgi:hypothetical protein
VIVPVSVKLVTMYSRDETWISQFSFRDELTKRRLGLVKGAADDELASFSCGATWQNGDVL